MLRPPSVGGGGAAESTVVAVAGSTATGDDALARGAEKTAAGAAPREGGGTAAAIRRAAGESALPRWRRWRREQIRGERESSDGKNKTKIWREEMCGCENYTPEELVRGKKGLFPPEKRGGVFFLTQWSRPPSRWQAVKRVINGL